MSGPVDDPFADAFGRLLEEQCTPAVVRSIEAGGSCTRLWQAIKQSGFADALVGEDQEGGGLTLPDAFALLELCGRHVAPVPVAQTMIARAVLAEAGMAPPGGTIAIATQSTRRAGVIRCSQVPFGRVADKVLLHAGEAMLLDVADASPVPGIMPLDATLEWPESVAATTLPLVRAEELETWQACCTAALIAGALGDLFRRTLQFANERQQFGRPIGKFQAIQHQLSVLAEQTFAARMAAQIGCSSTTWRPERLRSALAKARASEAAAESVAIAHSIHGAIGFTAEFDLQLYTRRLNAWRQAGGAESYWHDVLGAELLNRSGGLALDMIRDTTDSAESRMIRS